MPIIRKPSEAVLSDLRQAFSFLDELATLLGNKSAQNRQIGKQKDFHW